MAILTPSLWLPPGVRDYVDLNAALRESPYPAFTSGCETVSFPPDLVQDYIRELESNGFSMEARGHSYKMPPPELRKVIESDIIESAIREGVSLPTAVGFAKGFTYTSLMNTRDGLQQMLRNYAVDIERAIRLRGSRLPRPVYVAEYPWVGFNASVKRFLSGYVIFVHRGLMIALHAAAKIYSWSWNFIKVDDDSAHRSEAAWPLEHTVLALAQLVGEMIQRNATLAPRFRVPSGIRLWLYSSTLYSAELFVLAHEYAHILNDDASTLGEGQDDWIENAADSLAWHLLFADVDRSGRTPGGRDVAKSRISGVILLFGLRYLKLQVGEQVFRRRAVYCVSELDRMAKFRKFLERDGDRELLEHCDSCITWWQSATQCVLETCTWSPSNPAPF